MKIKELMQIVQIANEKTIIVKLKQVGYTLCNKNSNLGKVGIVELVNAITQETGDFADGDSRHLYNGRICERVSGYENYEFVLINVFDIKQSTDPFDDEATAIQTKMLIWAKEIQQNNS